MAKIEKPSYFVGDAFEREFYEDDDDNGNRASLFNVIIVSEDDEHRYNKFLAQVIAFLRSDGVLLCGFEAMSSFRDFDRLFSRYFDFTSVVLIPLYATNDCQPNCGAHGYFRITVANLENGSPRYWATFACALAYFTFVLYRLRIEWETFFALRNDFLVNGDGSIREDALTQFRHTVMVEHIPKTHRSQRELYNFWNALFPGQVKCTEVLINTSNLSRIVNERQRLIETFERIEASYRCAMWKYQHDRNLRLCNAPPKSPTLRIGGLCGPKKKVVEALPHLRSAIAECNNLALKEV
jgi:hypothetical protein